MADVPEFPAPGASVPRIAEWLKETGLDGEPDDFDAVAERIAGALADAVVIGDRARRESIERA